jgi:hypothetical protein
MHVEPYISPWLCILSALAGASGTASLLLILADFIHTLT